MFLTVAVRKPESMTKLQAYRVLKLAGSAKLALSNERVVLAARGLVIATDFTRQPSMKGTLKNMESQKY